MNLEAYSERQLEIEGWQVNVTSYRIGDTYHAKADNVSPGACIARATAATRAEVEEKVLEDARRRLARTRRQAV